MIVPQGKHRTGRMCVTLTEQAVRPEAILHTSGHCDEVSADGVVTAVLYLIVRRSVVSTQS